MQLLNKKLDFKNNHNIPLTLYTSILIAKSMILT